MVSISKVKYKVDRDLVAWLLSRKKEDFPQGTDYISQFNTLRSRLAEILKEVDRAALFFSAKELIAQGSTNIDDLVYLTNHGPEHVTQVIQRATDLLIDSKCKLSPYECYILLVAILFHDIGNLYGRAKHETKALEIMSALGDLAGADRLEQRTILKIALVHGGSYHGSKDTISRLQAQDAVLGITVRKRFLAAILRLADELADDCSRASRYMLRKGLLPKGSEIFHVYSDSLKSVQIEDGEIRLRFDLEQDVALREFTKGDKTQYLIDEINSRVLKMHRERIYCMRYMHKEVNLESIRVDITIHSPVDTIAGEDNQESILLSPERIQYTLSEIGYPGCEDSVMLYNCCGQTTLKTGLDIKNILEAKRSDRNG